MNSGAESDDVREIFGKNQDFRIAIVQQERGMELALQNAPESAFVDGQMMGGFLTQQVQDWAGPGAFLRKLAFRNRVMAYPGDSLTCRGLVTDVSATDEGGMVECDLWMENQRGEKVVLPASALLRLPLSVNK